MIFQVAGQTAMTQFDRAAQFTAGDVALVDAARPVTYLSRFGSPQWLTLRLPRKSLRHHLGFEPQGGVSRQRTRAGRLLFDLVRDADMDATSSTADIYMQFAVYDLVGALFRLHSAGGSRSRSMPMPRGRRPSTAALISLGARKASEMVMLTWRTLHFSRSQSAAMVVTRPEITSSSH